MSETRSEFANKIKQGDPKMTDAEFAVEMWHHPAILDLVGSGAILATAAAFASESQDLPDTWTVETVLIMLQHYSDRLDARGKGMLKL